MCDKRGPGAQLPREVDERGYGIHSLKFHPTSVCPSLFLAPVAIPGCSNFRKGGLIFIHSSEEVCPSWKYPACLLFVAEEEEEACSNCWLHYPGSKENWG